MASFGVMPRLTKKALKARLEKAQEQWESLVWMVPVNVPEEDLRKAEEEAARIESMTDEELEEYYRSPAGLAELAYERQLEREFEEMESIPIEQRPNPLGRKLIREGKLEYYQNVATRVTQGIQRKKIADELGVSLSAIKFALRVVRRLTGQDYTHHKHNTWEDSTRCPQCRGYLNSDTHKPYGEKLDGTRETRRKHKRKEIPQSELIGQPGGTDNEDENLEQAYIDLTYLKSQSKKGFPRFCAICGETVYTVEDAKMRHLHPQCVDED
jgi:hypothetical protein